MSLLTLPRPRQAKLSLRGLLLLIAGICVGLALANTLLNTARMVESGANNQQNKSLYILQRQVEDLQERISRPTRKE